MCKAFTASLLVAAFLVTGPTSSAGQSTIDFRDGSNWLAGYVANAPSQLLGIGVGAVLPALSGWGVYADAKLTTDSPARDAVQSMTRQDAEDLGDTFFTQSSAWTSANLAALKGLSPELALYLGAGLSWRTMYSAYVDLTGERGRYWVEDDEQPVLHPNVLGGAFFRLGRRITFQFGAERAPAGFTVGLHLLLW